MLSYRLKRTCASQRANKENEESMLNRRVQFRAATLMKYTEDQEGNGGLNDMYIRINIGGKTYCVRTELHTHDRTLMHDIVEANHEKRLAIVDGYDEKSEEYYMERNTRLAEHIMDFFATGSLHKPHNVCVERFKEELAFWRIGSEYLSACCALPSDGTTSTKQKHQQHTTPEDDYATDFDGVKFLSSFRLATWRFLEDPQSSYPAAVFALLSVFFVFTSVIGLILGSMPEFQEDSSNAAFYHMMHAKKGTETKFQNADVNSQNPSTFVYRPTDNPSFTLVVIEYICITWFTFEYLIRFTIYPRKMEFAKKTLNIIDMLTILPFYLELCLPIFGIESRFKELTGEDIGRKAQTWMGAMLVVRVLRVLRMARVFKLARYSTSLQTFGHTLKSSITELSMLSMFLVTGIIFFSTIMYYLEKDEPYTDFYSIPAGCWWCVVTMATVGYGDAKPVTTCGKLVATATSICGIIVLAFPISMIVEKFASAQQKAIESEQIQQDSEARLSCPNVCSRE
ncbi:unnamed protein product [Auanema sp. JU1783]|nr:unnamed protein product [Auanema sp. JU1783]